MPEPKRRGEYSKQPQTAGLMEALLQFLSRNPVSSGLRSAEAGQGFLSGAVNEVNRGFRNLGDMAAGPYGTAADFWLGPGTPAEQPPPTATPTPSVAARVVSDPGAAKGMVKPRASFAGYDQPMREPLSGQPITPARSAPGMIPPPDPFAPPPPQNRSALLAQMMFGGPGPAPTPGLPGMMPESPVAGRTPFPPAPSLPTGAGGFFYGLGGKELPEQISGGPEPDIPGSVRGGDALRRVLDVIRPRYTFPDTDVTMGWRTPETMGMERQSLQDRLEAMKLGGTLGLQGAQADYYRARAAHEADPMQMLAQMYPALGRLMAEEEATERAYGVAGMTGERQREHDILGYQQALDVAGMQGEYGLERSRISANATMSAAAIAAGSKVDRFSEAAVKSMLDAEAFNQVPSPEQVQQVLNAARSLMQRGDPDAQVLFGIVQPYLKLLPGFEGYEE